jgi:hypothetical protein
MRLLLLLLPSAFVACAPGKINVGDDTGGGGDDSGNDTVVSGAISVSPSSVSFDTVFVGATATKTVTVTNVGDGAVSLATQMSGAQTAAYGLTLDTPAPQPGAEASITLTLAPSNWGDHSVTLTITDADGDGHVAIPVAAWVEVDTDGDGYGSVESGGDDCADTDPTINPGVTETWYDGVDSNCDGLNDYDQDADGSTVDSDCDDTNADVHPGAAETWYDGIDADCAGDDDFDQDADGWDQDVDCDDTDAALNPAAAEVWYDGVDQDCDGNDADQDADGYDVSSDCDDTNPEANPGAHEIWYDGIDEACNGGDDSDQDGDGVAYPADCNDTDPTTTGPTTEVWDGIDNDCDGGVDNISITSARSGVLYGPTTSLGLGNRNGLSFGGDLTGDGLDDLVVASSSSGYGYAWVVTGSAAATASGSVESYDTAALVGAQYYAIGNIVGPAQDVTGDGTADLLIDGTGTYTSSYYGTYYTGESFLKAGGSNLTGSITLPSAFTASFDGDSSGDDMRWGVAGDVDGDGLADVVTGCPYDAWSGTTWGDYAYYTGNISVFTEVTSGSEYDLGDASDQIHGANEYDYLGYSVALGDLDGDGYDDIIAGAPGNSSAGDNSGAIFVLPGNSSATWSDDRADGAMTAQITGVSREDELGVDALATPGDIDGDHVLDLAVTNSSDGTVYVFYDGSSLTGTVSASTADLTLTGSGSFGSSIAYDTDLDADGVDDLIIGASGDDTTGSDAGAVYVFRPRGSTGAWTTASASATFYGAAAGDALGAGLAGGGDADGDGVEDLLVGASGQDGGSTGGGAVYVVLGR